MDDFVVNDIGEDFVRKDAYDDEEDGDGEEEAEEEV